MRRRRRLHAKDKAAKGRKSKSETKKSPTKGSAAKSAGSKRPPSKATTRNPGAAKTTRAGTGSSVRTPAERAAAAARRNRIPVVLAALAALVILATSFPLSELLGQHRQLSAEAAQLSQLNHQNALLNEQQQQLSSNTEIKRLAQQNYQLVNPGQSLFVILPPSGQSSSSPGAPTTGDPADQPLVSPSQAPNMTPDPGLPQATTSNSGSSSSSSGLAATSGESHGSAGFWSRVASSLEFWK